MAPPTPRRHDAAFTLLEMVIVLALMGMLVAVGMYGYKQMIATSNKADARERLTTMAAAEQAFARDWGSYTAWPADLPPRANSSRLVATDSTGPKEISVSVGDQGTLGMAVQYSAGCLYLRVDSLAKSGDVYTVTPDGACNGSVALPTGEGPLAPTPIAAQS